MKYLKCFLKTKYYKESLRINYLYLNINWPSSIYILFSKTICYVHISLPSSAMRIFLDFPLQIFTYYNHFSGHLSRQNEFGWQANTVVANRADNGAYA